MAERYYDPSGNRFRRNPGRDYDRDRGYDRRRWERTRQWQSSRADSPRWGDYRGENDFNERGSFDDQYAQEEDRNWDERYDQRGGREAYDRSRYEQDTYNRSGYERGEQYLYDPDQFERDYTYNQYRTRYDRDTNRDYGWQDRRRNRQGMRNKYQGPSGNFTAGMNADNDTGREPGWYDNYGSGAERDRGRYRDEGMNNYNYAQGDVGFDREGAFFQDLDEPENQEVWEFWEIPGRFTGIGPEHYRRSDESIEEAICERLTRHGRIDARDIRISVQDGEVTLAGSVPRREMKRLAEYVAEDTSGVRDVQNQIHISRLQHEWKSQGETFEPSRDRGSYSRIYDFQSNRAGQAERVSTALESPARETTIGVELPSESAASLTGSETASQHHEIKRGLREGMDVLSKSGKMIGRVKEIRDDDFLVDRPLTRDIYIPYTAVHSVGSEAMLVIDDDEVDSQNWPKPDLFGE